MLFESGIDCPLVAGQRLLEGRVDAEPVFVGVVEPAVVEPWVIVTTFASSLSS